MQTNNPSTDFPRPITPLRIGFDAKRAFNNATGLGNYSRFVINGLVKRYPQHQYFLLTPAINPEFKHFIPENDQVKIITPDSALGKWFPALWRSYALADICNELNLTIFHGLSNELPLGIERFKGKKIVTIHDLIFLRYPDYYKNIDRYIYTKKFRHACDQADLIIATSQQTVNDITRYFHTDSHKIDIGYQDCSPLFRIKASQAELHTARQQYQLSDHYLLCVGTIEQRKNQLTVLKAFHRISPDYPQLKLAFVGQETAYANELKAYIVQHHLQQSVLFMGRVPLPHLPAIYQQAKVSIYASEFEGFGIPVLEALCSGVPAVVANTSSLMEVGGNAAAYFPFNDAIKLAEQLRKVLSNTEAAQSMIKAGFNQAKLFDTNLLIDDLMRLYTQ